MRYAEKPPELAVAWKRVVEEGGCGAYACGHGRTPPHCYDPNAKILEVRVGIMTSRLCPAHAESLRDLLINATAGVPR